jgi:xanthine dehydrogenase YagS FAD-binding subunit
VDYHRPTTLSEAARLLQIPQAFALSGGTDLLVTMREGLARPGSVVDLRGIAGIDQIDHLPDGSQRIGAAVPLHSLGSDPGIGERFPALAQACRSVGSPALRNMGTIGGNLCQRPRCWYFRSGIPCLKSGGDSCPAYDGENRHHVILGGGPCYATHPSDPAVALAALEAIIEVNGPGGTRLVPIGEFFALPSVDPRRETLLQAHEFVTAVRVPAESATARQRYTKVLYREAWDFALASIAVVRRADGTVRMALGGVAPVPWRVSESVEEDLASGSLSEDDFDTLAARALYDARPLSGNAWKVDLAHTLLRDAMAFAASS